MSKRKVPPLLRKPEFATTGLAVGVGMGLLIGLIFELVWHHSMLVMQAGGLLGITVGGVFEAVRYGWRMRRFRILHRAAKAFATPCQ